MGKSCLIVIYYLSVSTAVLHCVDDDDDVYDDNDDDSDDDVHFYSAGFI